MTKEQLDSVLAIIDGYDARMKLVREYFDRREPVPEKYKQYLAALDDAEAVKAFEALRPLVARIRELERQRDWLAVFIEDNMDCDKCPYFLTVCTPEAPVDCAEWIKQAAKEAGE